MLLTSSQVSAAISGGIGLVLQQKSVQNLNEVLHPTGGRKGPWEALVARAEVAIEAQGAARLREIEAEAAAAKAAEVAAEAAAHRALWDRRAYVTVVRRPEDVCAAVMAVARLSVQGSPARRLLVHPAAWLDAATGDLRHAPETELIGEARREHLLETVGWDVAVAREENEEEDGDDGDGAAAKITVTSDHSIEEYLLGLHDFHQLLYLQADGLILNSSRLDALFDVKMTTAITRINRGDGDVAPAIMFRPGAASTKRSDMLLRGDDSHVGRRAGMGPYPRPVETSDNLKRIRREHNRHTGTEEENLLMKTGYVMLSPYRDLREEGDDGLNAEVSGSGQLRKRGGGATVPQDLGSGGRSLANDFINEHERHKEEVCGSMLSIVKRKGADDWAYA